MRVCVLLLLQWLLAILTTAACLSLASQRSAFQLAASLPLPPLAAAACPTAPELRRSRCWLAALATAAGCCCTSARWRLRACQRRAAAVRPPPAARARCCCGRHALLLLLPCPPAPHWPCAHREGEAVGHLHRLAHVQTQQLAGDDVGQRAITVLHDFEHHLAIQLHRLQHRLLHIRPLQQVRHRGHPDAAAARAGRDAMMEGACDGGGGDNGLLVCRGAILSACSDRCGSSWRWRCALLEVHPSGRPPRWFNFEQLEQLSATLMEFAEHQAPASTRAVLHAQHRCGVHLPSQHLQPACARRQLPRPTSSCPGTRVTMQAAQPPHNRPNQTSAAARRRLPCRAAMLIRGVLLLAICASSAAAASERVRPPPALPRLASAR